VAEALACPEVRLGGLVQLSGTSPRLPCQTGISSSAFVCFVLGCNRKRDVRGGGSILPVLLIINRGDIWTELRDTQVGAS